MIVGLGMKGIGLVKNNNNYVGLIDWPAKPLLLPPDTSSIPNHPLRSQSTSAALPSRTPTADTRESRSQGATAGGGKARRDAILGLFEAGFTPNHFLYPCQGYEPLLHPLRI